ncbi:MAG: DUF402 domain-containing protein [Promethearchaeota archaeon]
MPKPNKPNVFIRGIYSTALTKLFLDAGYPVIFPSKEIQKRFSISFRPNRTYSKDITIRDRLDMQGISIMFKKKVWEQLIEEGFKDFPLSHEKNPNLIIYNARFHKNSIYRGLIIKSNQKFNYSYIRLIPEEVNSNGVQEDDEFRTTLGRYPRYIPDSKEGIFQVTHEDCGKSNASIGSFYTIPGDLIVIVPYNNRVIISKEITQGYQKKRLFDLGKSIQQEKKYGFIFRTAAQYASDQEIVQEANELEEDLIKTQNEITQFPDKIGEIYSNYRSMNIIFPAQVKREFDGIRSDVVSTLDYHHMLKSGIPKQDYQKTSTTKAYDRSNKRRQYNKSEKQGKYERNSRTSNQNDESPQFGVFIEFTEKLIKNINPEGINQINENFLHNYFKETLKNRSQINILHQKLTGKTLSLTPGYIQHVENSRSLPVEIVVKRRLHAGGLYDGLNTPIENGDYAISEFQQGSWYYISSYYDQKGELKGRYFNINTPIEISQTGVHYIDLEIDVIENMVGERKIIDQELLDRALEYGIITDEIHGKAMVIAENICDGKI